MSEPETPSRPRPSGEPAIDRRRAELQKQLRANLLRRKRKKEDSGVKSSS